jgi:Spy/CpxP family protein refolding chaperone
MESKGRFEQAKCPNRPKQNKSQQEELNMKSKKVFVVGIILTMFFAGSVAAMAGEFSPRHHRHGMGPRLFGLKTMLELKLSDSQQTDVLNIISKYENEMKNNRDSIRQARKNLMAAMHVEAFNEEELRTAFKQLSSIREESIVSRGKMMSELKAVLTPEQMTLLKERKTQRMEWRKARLGACLENQGE